MNTNLLLPLRKVLGASVVALLFASQAYAAEQLYSDVPLFWANGVSPNVALMLDNSYSMGTTDAGSPTPSSQSRENAVQIAAKAVVDSYASSMRIGLFDFTGFVNTTSPAAYGGSGQKVQNCGTAAATLNTSIGALSSPALTGSTWSVATSGPSATEATPLVDSMATIVNYFNGPNGPIQYRCQKNFVVFFTDGAPTAGSDALSSPSLLPTLTYTPSYAAGTNPWPNTTAGSINWDGYPEPVYTTSYSGRAVQIYSWLDDLVQFAYDADFRTDTSTTLPAATCGGTAPSGGAGYDCANKRWDGDDDTPANKALYKQQNITTYVVGFSSEATNELMRDTPLVNRIAITPSMVSTSNDTINISKHGLKTGDYVLYYAADPLTYTEAVTANTGTDTLSGTTVLTTTGTPVTYDNAGGTALTYATTCGAVGGLTSGSSYYVAYTGPNKFKLATSSANATSCAAGTTAKCITLSSGGVIGTSIIFTKGVVSQSTTATAAGITPIDTGTATVTLLAHGYTTGNQVTYTCANGSTPLITTAYAAVSGGTVKLANSAANAALCAAGTTSACLDITNAGNSGQTLTYTGVPTGIGGLYPYETDAIPDATPNPATESAARGKYYVEYVDADHFKLRAVGAYDDPDFVTTTDLTTPTGAIQDITSTGYGILSTGPGKAYFSQTSTALAAALNSAFSSISSQKLSQSSLAANTSQLGGGAYLFQASFNTADWSGDIKAFDVSTGTIDLTAPTWTASQNVPAAASRKIFTWNGSAGVAFPATGSTTGLTATQLTSMDPTAANQQAVVNWVRGTDGTLRARSNGLYGDILNGSPIYVGPPSGSYNTLLSTVNATEASAYSTFKTTNATRTPMLYVGANDGMLHGLDASTNSTQGDELMAFIPNGVYRDWVDTGDDAQLGTETVINKFKELSATGYGVLTGQKHRYFVDGAPNYGDAYWGGAWHTVLVGGLGKGGRSIYALDITSPTTVLGGGVGAFAATNVLWEFASGSAGCNGSSGSTLGCMGYSFSRPVIARLNTGVWAAIFGNGYDSNGDASKLFILNLQTGALIKELDVAGTGLSPVTVYNNATTGLAETVYAGDLNGTVWRFDIKSSSTGSWSSSKLFVTSDGTNPQPITAPITLGDNATATTGPGVMVYVGTGRYFTDADKNYVSGTSTPTYDSLYALWDNASGTIAKSTLQVQTITTGITASTGQLTRTISANAVSYPASGVGSHGWYIDLKVGSTLEGERVTFAPLVVGDVLFVSTVVPDNADPCTGGGTSWLYGIKALTGAAADIFDLANDGTFDTGVSGIQSSNGVYSQPTYLADSSGSSTGKVYVNTSGGVIESFRVTTCPGCTTTTNSLNSGRMTWRQLQ